MPGREEPVTLKGSCLCGAVRYEVDRLEAIRRVGKAKRAHHLR
jgi:hypothetical protein